MARISVILPVYKVEKYIRKSVETILNQTFGDFEIILVDDGSPDNSGKVCDELAGEDNRIRVIHKENAGSGYARNAGLEIAEGKYIYFMDPDDFIDPDLLSDNKEILEKTGADIVAFGHTKEVIGGDGEAAVQSVVLPAAEGVVEYSDFKRLFPEIFKTNPYNVWNKMYKRSFLKENNYLFTNQRVGQDALFNLMIYENPFTIVYNKKSYYHYIVHENSAVTKYHSERFSYEFNIASKLSELLTGWDKNNKEYLKISAMCYEGCVETELNSICSVGCTMTKKEKISHIRTIRCLPEIRNAVKTLGICDIKPMSLRVRFVLLKARMYRILIRCIEYKKKIGRV